MQRFQLSVGEPWNFEGPDGPNRVVVDLVGFVGGPSLPNWQDRYLLLKVVAPFTHKGERVALLVASPRYEGDTLEGIVASGGTVGVSRVRPNAQLQPGSNLDPKGVEYIIIGGLLPLREETPNVA
jgi:hypothetical protein